MPSTLSQQAKVRDKSEVLGLSIIVGKLFLDIRVRGKVEMGEVPD